VHRRSQRTLCSFPISICKLSDGVPLLIHNFLLIWWGSIIKRVKPLICVEGRLLLIPELLQILQWLHTVDLRQMDIWSNLWRVSIRVPLSSCISAFSAKPWIRTLDGGIKVLRIWIGAARCVPLGFGQIFLRFQKRGTILKLAEIFSCYRNIIERNFWFLFGTLLYIFKILLCCSMITCLFLFLRPNKETWSTIRCILRCL